MRRLFAILLICVFAWSHYVKQVVYLECRMSNTFKSFATKCDCEAKSGLETKGTNSIPLSTTHSHNHLDELFPITKELRPDFSCKAAKKNNTPAKNEAACNDFYNSPFHPPRIA